MAAASLLTFPYHDPVYPHPGGLNISLPGSHAIDLQPRS
jgi:hypothetical protein